MSSEDENPFLTFFYESLEIFIKFLFLRPLLDISQEFVEHGFHL